MKQIILKEGTRDLPGQDPEPLRTTDFIRYVLDLMPPGGFTRDDFKKRDRVEKAIEGYGLGPVLFEDQDFETLRDCVEKARWKARDPFISDFIESVLTAGSGE